MKNNKTISHGRIKPVSDGLTNPQSYTDTGLPIKKLYVPKTERIFSEEELAYLNPLLVGQGKLTFKSKRCESFRKNIALFILIVEHNMTLDKEYVEIPYNYLKKLFNNSGKTTTRVIDFVKKNNIAFTNNHYVVGGGTSKGYTIHDDFKKLRKYEAIEKLMEQQPIEDEIEELEEVEDLEIIKQLVLKFNQDFYHNRLKAIGVNPTDYSTCSCCGQSVPNYLYAIGRNNRKYEKCRICFTKEEQKVDSSEGDKEAIETAKGVLETLQRIKDKRCPIKAALRLKAERKSA